MKHKQFRSKRAAGSILTNAARKIAVIDANSTCAWLGYQSVLPEAVKKLRKL